MDVLSNIIPVPNHLIRLRKDQCSSEVIFDNGNKISIVPANENSRGCRFNGAIVDNETDIDVIDCVITPQIMPLKNNDGLFDKNDNPSTRIYYVDIGYGDLDKSKKYNNNQLIYVSSKWSNVNELSQWQKEILNKYINNFNDNMLNILSKYEKEYECMWIGNDYDRPVITKELNNDKVMLFEAWGIPKENITYEIEFINKTRQTFLNVTGRAEIIDLGFENDINIHMLIDTEIYDGYEVNVDNGMVMVILHEIENEQPVLKGYVKMSHVETTPF
ncbi:hypothetical protein [Kineothrix sedimenti]|uniref:Uncharacterized protein n=1 Tax=Kineothrix sedimenti TaxID=3123317 RepID=A0ABZ3F2B4_9FIRM